MEIYWKLIFVIGKKQNKGAILNLQGSKIDIIILLFIINISNISNISILKIDKVWKMQQFVSLLESNRRIMLE